MNHQPFPDDFEKGLAEFLAAEEVKPPRALTDQILEKVQADLNPPVRNVLAKVGAIHLATGILTLIVCPQFGIGWTDLSFRFHEHLGGVHSIWCTLLCGALFLGSGAVIVSTFLRPEELRVLRQWHFLHIPFFAVLSIAVFLVLGQAPLSVLHSLVWLLGGVLCMTGITLAAVRYRLPMLPIHV